MSDFTSRRRRVLMAVFLLVVLAGVAWGVDRLIYRTTHSVSKDAFIETHLINISPQVAGDVVAVHVQEQDLVKKGQVLAKIDPTPYQREVDLAKAKLATAEAALEKTKADLALLTEEVPRQVAIADARLSVAKEDEKKAGDSLEIVTTDTDKAVAAAQRAVDAAKAAYVLADEDFRRYRDLFTEGSVPLRKFQEATKNHDTSRADVEIAEAKLAQAQANRKQSNIAGQTLSAAKHTVLEAEAALALAKLGSLRIAALQQQVAERSRQAAESKRALELAEVNLAYTDVVAPYDGVIAKKWRHLGDYARTGDPIFSVYNPDLLYVTVNLEETRLEGVRPGNGAELRIDAFSKPFRGRVAWVGSATSANFSLIPRDVSSGEFTYVVQRVPTRIVIERDERWHLLKPGLSVTAAIEHGDGNPAWAAEANRKLAEIEGVARPRP